MTSLEKSKRLRLPRLSNQQYEYVEKVCRDSGIPIGQCPTCLARPIEIDAGVYGWENGTYRLDGEEHECDCQTQMDLRVHYLLANIGEQYQRLDWNRFQGSKDAKDGVALFLEKWRSFKLNGMGLEFSSPVLGTGKTFAATHLGKEMVKQGEAVYFMPFRDIIDLLGHDRDYRTAQENRLRETTILILDEVVPAISAAQRELFAVKFEDVIRYRTNFNRVTIMTTNLEPEDLHKEYPRTYSLLEAKQIRVKMTGDDARMGFIGMENLELVANDEVRPIT